MLKDITLGQYYPGTSSLHKVDPRVKIILSLMYMTSVFVAKNIYSFGLIVLFTCGVIALSRISFKVILKAVKPLIFIVAFTAIVNIFWTSGETVIINLGFTKIYYEGVMYAVLMVVRIISLLAGTSVILTYTTTPIALTDGIERLLSPLKKIKLPVHEFAMMMTIALRFVPTLIEETDKIMGAQKARGADFTSGNLKNRAKSLVPILIPLFVSAFRRADDLAVAMECRCYRGGEGRTRMTVLKLTANDYIWLLVMVLFIVLIIFANMLKGFSL